MLDPTVAHRLPGHVLDRLVGRGPDPFTVRTDFARYLTTPQGRTATTWQDAWNAWTGATPARPGRITIHGDRCTSCNGRGYHVRFVARTGNGICPDCMGTRRNRRPQHFTANYAQGDPS
jgi:hypothetical protein